MHTLTHIYSHKYSRFHTHKMRTLAQQNTIFVIYCGHPHTAHTRVHTHTLHTLTHTLYTLIHTLYTLTHSHYTPSHPHTAHPHRQKVTLWQHADELEQEQIAMGTWINDKAVTECMACGTAFTVFHRKVSSLE